MRVATGATPQDPGLDAPQQVEQAQAVKTEDAGALALRTWRNAAQCFLRIESWAMPSTWRIDLSPLDMEHTRPAQQF